MLYERINGKRRGNHEFLLAARPAVRKRDSEFYDNPRPHFNTVSTIVRGLEEKGYIGHKPFGKTYQYYATVSAADMGVKSLKSIISRYFKNSYLGVVSSLVKDENISVDELRRLLDEVEKGEAGRNQQ